MKNQLHLIVLLFAVFSACVPQQKYLDLVQEQENLQKELAMMDSLANARSSAGLDVQEMESELAKAYRENEQLRSTNQGLNQSYQDLLQRYSIIVGQNNEIVNSAGDRQYNLQQELTTRGLQLEERNKNLQLTEQQLKSREQYLNNLERSYTQDVASRDQQILKLQNELYRREKELQGLRNSINLNLNPTNRANLDDFEISASNGRLKVLLREELLFSTGSAFISSTGKQALRRIVDVLQQNPTVNVLIEGHTDNTGTPEKNWALSVDRALAVAKTMISYGISPSRVTASGRGQYSPIAPNTTTEGRSRNRRTEVILVPSEDGINTILFQQN